MNKQTGIGIAVVLMFILGTGYIILQGRPVVDLREELLEQEHDDNDMGAEGASTEMDTPEEVEDASESTDTIATTISESNNSTTDSEPPVIEASGVISFSMTTVATHSVRSDCWTAINGSVYDLTTWVDRHPGGSRAIESLCGIDGSSEFNRRHGRSNAAQQALGLLKIGELK